MELDARMLFSENGRMGRRINIKRGGRGRHRKPIQDSNVFGDIFALIGWFLLGLVVFFLILLFIAVPLQVIPVGILLTATFFARIIFTLGNDGVQIAYTLYLGARNLFELQIIVGNAFSALAPSVATLWNILWDILIAIFVGGFELICDVQPGDPGFDALLNCPRLSDWLLLAPSFVEILLFVIEFTIFITDLFTAVLLPSFCIKRDIPTPVPPFFPFFIQIDFNCTIVCGEIGRPGGCQSFASFLTWFLQSFENILHTLFNIADLVFPWIFGTVYTMLEDSGIQNALPNLIHPETLWDLFQLMIDTDGELFFALLLGYFINTIAVIPDTLYCLLLTTQIEPCFFGALCHEIFDINIPFGGNVNDVCADPGPCACFAHPTFYTQFSGGGLPGAPCSSFATSGCVNEFTIIEDLLGLFLNTISNVQADLT